MAYGEPPTSSRPPTPVSAPTPGGVPTPPKRFQSIILWFQCPARVSVIRQISVFPHKPLMHKVPLRSLPRSLRPKTGLRPCKNKPTSSSAPTPASAPTPGGVPTPSKRFQSIILWFQCPTQVSVPLWISVNSHAFSALWISVPHPGFSAPL
jgi:hypothetical protein